MYRLSVTIHALALALFADDRESALKRGSAVCVYLQVSTSKDNLNFKYVLLQNNVHDRI